VRVYWIYTQAAYARNSAPTPRAPVAAFTSQTSRVCGKCKSSHAPMAVRE